MRNKLAILSMCLGVVLLLCSAGLLIYNEQEASRFQKFSDDVIAQLEARLEASGNQPGQSTGDDSGTNGSQQTPEDVLPPVDVVDPYDATMTEVEIDGLKYIGYLYLPDADLKVPVLTDWSIEKLRIAPCRYHGSTKTDDIVIMAHNNRHFKKIADLVPGDVVIFTDMDGTTTMYEVVVTEILGPNATEDMIAGVYDFTMFTCTYGGQNRVTVRCNRVEN